MLSLGKACTEIMIEKSRDLTMLLNNTSSLLVPIPMPRLRKWTRGGNHAEYIATTISTKTHIPFHTHLLIRKKTTHQQARFRTRSEREKGITGAFGVDTKMLLESPIPKDTKIILVDDVTTTGATLLEAKKVLEKAGFTSISAITIAH